MPDTPAALQRCFDIANLSAVTVLGNLALLDGILTSFFCSVRCPGDVILKTYDLAEALRGTEIRLIGGFQSPMEKEFLDVLLWGQVRVVIRPARGLDNMRVPKTWRTPLAGGRLLILSFFDDNVRRPTAASVARRNAYVATVADCLLVAHAQPNQQDRSAVQARPDESQAGLHSGLAIQRPPYGAWCLALFGGQPAALSIGFTAQGGLDSMTP